MMFGEVLKGRVILGVKEDWGDGSLELEFDDGSWLFFRGGIVGKDARIFLNTLTPCR